MIIERLRKQSVLLFLLTILLMYTLTTGAEAVDVNADSCSSTDIQAAVNIAEAAGDGGTVYIPAGECTWSGGSTDRVNVSKPISIIGAGVANTIININRTGSYGAVNIEMDVANKTSFVRISGIKWITLVNTTVYRIRDLYSFRFDHSHFEGDDQINSPIGWKNATKGLIDNNVFINPNNPVAGSYYGPGAGSSYAGGLPTQSCDEDLCFCWVGNEDAGPESSSVASGNTVISPVAAIIDNAGGSGTGVVRRIYFEIDSVGSNPTVNIASFENIGGNTFTARARATNLPVAVGKNIFEVDDGDFPAFAINAGDYIGLYLNDAAIDAASGSTSWTVNGDQTNQSSVNFGAPDIGSVSIGAEIYDNEDVYKNCEADWDYWYDDVGNQRPSYSGFNEDFEPNSDQAIYFEDNTFTWYKTMIEGNWGNSSAFVVRHNTFYTPTGLLMIGFKPGTIFAMVHDNTFEYTGAGTGGYAVRLRSSGLVYNNTIKNLNNGVLSNAFRSNGFQFTHQVRPDEAYIFNNTYQNCNCGSNDADCWGGIGGGGDYAVSGTGENGNYHFRAPKAGERLYGFQEFTYPHPLQSGGDDVAPSPAKTLSLLNFY